MGSKKLIFKMRHMFLQEGSRVLEERMALKSMATSLFTISSASRNTSITDNFVLVFSNEPLNECLPLYSILVQLSPSFLFFSHILPCIVFPMFFPPKLFNLLVHHKATILWTSIPCLLPETGSDL